MIIETQKRNTISESEILSLLTVHVKLEKTEALDKSVLENILKIFNIRRDGNKFWFSVDSYYIIK